MAMARMRSLTRIVTVVGLVLLGGMGMPARTQTGDVGVMTRNLYVGADLTPVIAATTPAEFIQAVNSVLLTIGASDFPQRSVGLAREIADKRPHLVGLQEVFQLTLNGNTGAPPFRDLLQDLLDSLAAQGAEYYVVGEVRNLDVTIPVPGLGVVHALDRDIVLARGDVPASAVAVPGCRVSVDGCNYQVFAALQSPVGPLNIERGFLVVDAAVQGQSIRFVNTHLEVPELPRVIQAAQAFELIGLLDAMAVTGQPVVIAGDINSAPTEGDVITAGGVIPSPYRQFLAAGYADTWDLRPGKSPGLTCCQANDLRNDVSQLFKRVDVIFARTAPAETQATLVGVDQEDKTLSGLWPSDHAGVVARLRFDQ